MSEDTTRNMPDKRSFEERVFILLNAMNDRLTALEEKVDARLRETRPIWEGVLERLTAIESRLVNVEARLTGMEERLISVEVRLDKIDDQLEAFNDKMDVLNDNIFDMRADHKSLKKRVIKLEDESLPQQ